MEESSPIYYSIKNGEMGRVGDGVCGRWGVGDLESNGFMPLSTIH
jgi:hypothetical protein